MARTETDVEFRASDLIGPAGVGSNGEKLVNTLHHHYPPELKAALIKRINPELDAKLDDSARGKIAKVVGVSEIADAHVRGGANRSDQAWITYAWLDDEGQVWKGCFPFEDLGSGKSDRHVSQVQSLADSPEGQQHVAEHPHGSRRDADSESASAGEPQDPFDVLENASAEELVELMREHPDRAKFVKQFERATRGNNARKTVLEFDPKAESSGGGDGGQGGQGGSGGSS